MIIGGVDGCRAGWLLVKWDAHIYTHYVCPDFATLLRTNPDLEQILVDIPIGLSEQVHLRTIDRALRKELPGRASTVFNAPCRAAVYESDPDRARLLNQQVEGKSLSVQSLHIRHKIREVDECLLTHSELPQVWESHPELCFKYLNDGKVVLSRKATATGVAERLQILSRYDTKLTLLFDRILAHTKRSEVKRDDILDAICLCLVGVLGQKNGLRFMVDDQKQDQKNIPISLAYYHAV